MMAPLRMGTAAFCASLIAGSAMAGTPSLHGTFSHWRSFTVTQDGSATCYIASEPTKKTGNYRKRSEPFVIVTHRKGGDEVSVSSGYPYQKGKEVTVVIDGQTHQLFTQGERGWAKDSATDQLLVGRMKNGSAMTVKGTSQAGTYSTDSYSLRGFTAAYRDMLTRCK